MQTIRLRDAVFLALAYASLAPPEVARGATRMPSLQSLMPGPDVALHNAVAIGLTTEQREKIEAIEREHDFPVQQAEAEVRRATEVLVVLLGRRPVDDAAVEAQFAKLHAAEGEVKRLRLKMSLCTKAVLSPEQEEQLTASHNRRGQARTTAPESAELTTKTQRLRELIQTARERKLNVSSTRAVWKRVGQLKQDGEPDEACRVLDEEAQKWERTLSPKPEERSEPATEAKEPTGVNKAPRRGPTPD
jgi:Spy/CpxP family protein refolding chaperone